MSISWGCSVNLETLGSCMWLTMEHALWDCKPKSTYLPSIFLQFLTAVWKAAAKWCSSLLGPEKSVFISIIICKLCLTPYLTLQSMKSWRAEAVHSCCQYECTTCARSLCVLLPCAEQQAWRYALPCCVLLGSQLSCLSALAILGPEADFSWVVGRTLPRTSGCVLQLPVLPEEDLEEMVFLSAIPYLFGAKAVSWV